MYVADELVIVGYSKGGSSPSKKINGKGFLNLKYCKITTERNFME